MTAPGSIRQKVIALVEQLPEDQLVQVVEWLETLSGKISSQTEIAARSEQEERLLQIIQRRLSAYEQLRLSELRQHNEAGEIADAEHQELLAFVEQIEQQDAERAAALIQLAQLRNVDLKVLVKEFLPVHESV